MQSINKGISLFNDGYYFEAHDFFEDLWMDEKGKFREFLQALVQVSVGSYHFENENIYGALSQYQKALKKFQKYEVIDLGIDIIDLMNKLKNSIVLLEKLRKENSNKQIDFSNFPKIEIIKNN